MPDGFVLRVLTAFRGVIRSRDERGCCDISDAIKCPPTPPPARPERHNSVLDGAGTRSYPLLDGYPHEPDRSTPGLWLLPPSALRAKNAHDQVDPNDFWHQSIEPGLESKFVLRR